MYDNNIPGTDSENIYLLDLIQVPETKMVHATHISLNSTWVWAKDCKGLFVFNSTILKQEFLLCLPIT